MIARLLRSNPAAGWRALGLLFAALLFARGAAGHTIPGGITLSERVALADVVVVATIKRPVLPDSTPGKATGHLLAEATVVERLRGEPPPGPLRFEPHSHSGESYREGEQVVLFLRAQGADGSKVPEYGTVDDLSDRVSLGTPGAERASAAEVLAAVRAYTNALAAGDDGSRSAQRKAATLALLRSPDARLQASALRDLAQGSVILTAADVPPLLEFADQAQTPMASRVLLLEELARRRLADPTDRYVRWLAAASLAELVPLARAAGRHNHPAITEALAARLKDADEGTATLAARAIGEPFHDSAVPLLATLAAAPDHRKLANASIESLGRMGTPAARQALSELLAKVEDPARQRAIQTQLNRLAQQAPSVAPSSSASAAGEAGRGGPAAASSSDTDRPRSWRLALGLAVMAALAAAALLWLLRRRR